MLRAEIRTLYRAAELACRLRKRPRHWLRRRDCWLRKSVLTAERWHREGNMRQSRGIPQPVTCCLSRRPSQVIKSQAKAWKCASRDEKGEGGGGRVPSLLAPSLWKGKRPPRLGPNLLVLACERNGCAALVLRGTSGAAIRGKKPFALNSSAEERQARPPAHLVGRLQRFAEGLPFSSLRF